MRKSFYLRLWSYSDDWTTILIPRGKAPKLGGRCASEEEAPSGTGLVAGGEMGTCLAEVEVAG